MDKNVILHALVTEKPVGLIESENKLVFIVEKSAKKQEIKEEFEKEYAMKVRKVNTVISPEGIKKAYIALDEPGKASELAMKLKIL
jgi:large subunit ribosomal protein L23